MEIESFQERWSLLHQIRICNEPYKFYYDETNNIQKFHLNKNGVNAKKGLENDFILGGVLLKLNIKISIQLGFIKV